MNLGSLNQDLQRYYTQLPVEERIPYVLILDPDDDDNNGDYDAVADWSKCCGSSLVEDVATSSDDLYGNWAISRNGNVLRCVKCRSLERKDEYDDDDGLTSIPWPYGETGRSGPYKITSQDGREATIWIDEEDFEEEDVEWYRFTHGYDQ